MIHPHRALAALLLLGALLVGAAPAATAAPERIAVVDMVALITEHSRATELEAMLEQRLTEIEAYAREEQKSLRELQAQIELMARTNPMRRVREKELLFQQEMLKLELKWREQEANREYMDGLESLYISVQQQVARYARERGILIVLLKTEVAIKAVDPNDYGAKVRLRAVVYHDETLDITADLKAILASQRQNQAEPGQPAGTQGQPPANR